MDLMAQEGAGYHVLLIGTSYRLAPVEVLEGFVRRASELKKQFSKLRPTELFEIVVLCTCNRAEVYATTRFPAAASRIISGLLTDKFQPANTESYLYSLTDEEAVEHLLAVSSGIDSMVVGEPQILLQVEDALKQATEIVGPLLTRLFNRAIRVGKRVRSETLVGRDLPSLGSIVQELLKSEIGGQNPTVMLLGSGKIGKDIAQHLARNHIKIVMASRSPQRVSSLLGALAIKAISFKEISQELEYVDGLICATSSEGFLITSEQVRKAISRRSKKGLILVDMGVPRNIDPKVRYIDGVTLRTLDDIAPLIEEKNNHLQPEIAKAMRIIQDEAGRFIHERELVKVEPVIKDLHKFAEVIRQCEVEETLRRLPNITALEKENVISLSKSIANGILHIPTRRLRDLAGNGDASTYSSVLADLFDLKARSNLERKVNGKQLQPISSSS